MSNFQIILFTILLVLLIVLAAFFSSAETSLMALNRYRLRHQARMQKQDAIRLLQLLRRPDRLLGAILIGNTFANMLASSLATLIAFHYFGEEGALIAAVLLTVVVLIFAEIAPKTVAAIYPDQIARLILNPIQFFLKLLYPLVWCANTLVNAVLRLGHLSVMRSTPEPISREELKSVVYEATGKISKPYQQMLLSILDLNKLTVDDIMLPKHMVQGIDIANPWEIITVLLSENKDDWIPFYDDNIDKIIGVLHASDVMSFLNLPTMPQKKDFLKILHEPYFVPEGTSLQTQLRYFQSNRQKIAFVVDEYGDIQGSLTLYNIVEEIVGNINTNLPTEKYLALQADGSYLIEGNITVRNFNRLTGWELPLSGPRTINGLITEYLQSLPHAGIAVLIAGYPIEIILVKEKRVELARVFPQIHLS